MKQFIAQGTEKRTGRQIRIGLRAPNRGWAVWIAMTQFSYFIIREGRIDQVEKHHDQTLDQTGTGFQPGDVQVGIPPRTGGGGVA